MAPLGTVLLLTLPDGSSRYGMRLGDGLAVCTVLPPDTLDIQDGEAVAEWMASARRLWVLVSDQSMSWIFANWYPREGVPVGLDEGVLPGDVSVFEVASTAVLAASMLFPVWKPYTVPNGVGMDLRHIWTHPAGAEA